MQDVQQVFLRLQDHKAKLKQLNEEFKQELQEVPEYLALSEQKTKLNEEINQIKSSVKDRNPELINKIEDLKIDIASDKEMLSDMILNKYVAGESIELKDEYENNYQLSFSFTAKKA